MVNFKLKTWGKGSSVAYTIFFSMESLKDFWYEFHFKSEEGSKYFDKKYSAYLPHCIKVPCWESNTQTKGFIYIQKNPPMFYPMLIYFWIQ